MFCYKVNLKNKWEGFQRKRYAQSLKRINSQNINFYLNTKELSKLVSISCESSAKAYIETIWAGAGSVKIGVYGMGRLRIGKDICINANCIILCRESITIGKNVMLGPNVVIIDHDHDYKSINWRNQYKTGKIEIGNNVWIGAGAIILKGAKIGDNTVIGAGSLIKGIIQANSVAYDSRKLEIKKFVRK